MKYTQHPLSLGNCKLTQKWDASAYLSEWLTSKKWAECEGQLKNDEIRPKTLLAQPFFPKEPISHGISEFSEKSAGEF